MRLTPREIEDRLEEAAYTLRNLPEKDRPRGYGSFWPPVVHDAKHAYGYTPERPMRVIPSAAAISRMEECFDWLLMLNPEDARIVWLRAEGARTRPCRWPPDSARRRAGGARGHAVAASVPLPAPGRDRGGRAGHHP